MSDDIPTVKVSRSMLLLIVTVVTAEVTTLLALQMPAALKSFDILLRGFGPDRSALTRLVLSHPYVWWWFAALSMLTFVWVASSNRVSSIELARMKLALRLTIGLSTLAYGVAAYAMYSPIFQLGSLV